MPFMAFDLLTEDAWGGMIERRCRHPPSLYELVAAVLGHFALLFGFLGVGQNVEAPSRWILAVPLE